MPVLGAGAKGSCLPCFAVVWALGGGFARSLSWIESRVLPSNRSTPHKVAASGLLADLLTAPRPVASGASQSLHSIPLTFKGMGVLYGLYILP